MRRLLSLSVPVLALLAATLAAGERRAERSDPKKAGPAPKAEQPDSAPSFFDAAAFLKDHDRDQDGRLARKELPKRYREHFDRIDTDRDGKLTRKELEKGGAHLQVRRRPSDVVFVLVEMSDCDECCAEEVQRLYDLLRKLDRNGDHKVDADELRSGREAIIKERVANLLEDLDADRDGTISKGEARGQVRRYFAKIDTSKDGRISPKELAEAASERPERVAPPGAGTPRPRK